VKVRLKPDATYHTELQTAQALGPGSDGTTRSVSGEENEGFGLSIRRSGIGRPAKSLRHGIAISLAHRAERLTRALSVAIPVFAYIWR
jgi:hypothetical protein